MTKKLTPSQTIGPFFAYGLTPEQYGYDFKEIASGTMIDDTVEGERIVIKGRVLDGKGTPVDDAMIEIYQTDHKGEYVNNTGNSNFTGFGRFGTGTDPENRFIFSTIKPGSMDGQAPHITFMVFGRGMLNHQYTRLYFSDEDNSTDPVLQLVPRERRHTLIAEKKGHEYHFDIVLQGDNETVFFDI